MEIFVSFEDKVMEDLLFLPLKEAGVNFSPLPEDPSTIEMALIGVQSEKDLEKIENIRKENKEALLIAVLAYKNEVIKDKALNSGADEVLSMPIDVEEFKAIFSSLTAALKIREPYSVGRLTEFRRWLDNMIELTREKEILSFDFLEKLDNVAAIRDNETANHTQRVGKISELLAENIGMSPRETIEMRLTAPLHDIGKIGIPDAILFKEGPLSDDEWKIMKTHTEIGARILKSKFGILKRAQKIALYHHEKYDGSGYPKGIKGEDIPLEARIVAIADSFDAIVSKRAYKKAMKIIDAVDEIVKNSGTQFDPQLVKAFVKMAERVETLYQNVGIS